MSSIIDLVSSQLGGDAMDRLGAKLGQDKQATEKGVQSALAVLVGGLSRNAQKDGGEGLAKALSSGHDGSILDKVGGFIDSDSLKDGQGILGHVLGSRSDAAAKMVSTSSGISQGQASSLMAMLAPVVMGAIAKSQQGGSGAAGSLTDLLKGEEKNLGSMAPAAMSAIGGLLDADGDGDTDLSDIASKSVGLLKKFF